MPTLTIKEASNYFGKDGPLAKQMKKAAQKGLLSAALRMQQLLVVREVPKAIPTPVDKGIYRAGWKVEKLPNGAAIYNAVPYAVFIEYGVKGGNVVMGHKFQLALTEWVRRKLGAAGSTSPTRVRPVGAKKTYNEREKHWNKRIRQLSKKLKKLKGKRRVRVQLQGASNPAYEQAWRVAGAIMHSMKKRGIFNRGAGLRIMEKFVKSQGGAIVREEVQKMLSKELP